MRRTVMAVATAAALCAAPAAAEEVGIEGVLCGYSSLVDPRDGDDSQLAEIDGGPLVVTGVEPGATVELICTIQVDWATHAGPDAASVSGSGPGVVVVPPTLVPYEAGNDSNIILCNEVRVTTASGVQTFYWDDFEEEWSSSPDVGCYDLAPDPSPPIGQELDQFVCPVLVERFPPEGDIEGFWDCPPYGS